MKLQPRIFFSHFLQDKRKLLVLIEVPRSIDTSLSFPSKAKNSTQLQTTAKAQSALPPQGGPIQDVIVCFLSSETGQKLKLQHFY